MSLTESISAIVTEPNIIASSGQDKSRSDLRVIEYPLHHIGLEAVLQKDRWLRTRRIVFLKGPRNSPDAKDVAVGGRNVIALNSEAILLSQFLHGFESIRPGEFPIRIPFI